MTSTTPPASDSLEAALRDLALVAPPALAVRTLVETGFADEWATVPSPLGPIAVVWNGRGISWIDRADDPEALEDRFTERVGRPLRRVADVPPRLTRAITARLAGDRRAKIALDLRGRTPFEVAVWMKALEIPRGEVRPYGWIAAEIGRPKAVRAVGSALAHNPVPLVVPCHRVVRSDGSIGQYSLGGPNAKRTVLVAEGLTPDQFEVAARTGRRFLGSTTTKIVCLPTCHNARRISEAHRRPFASMSAAVSAGYRACKACRPLSGAALAA